jgi:hypothetical protein
LGVLDGGMVGLGRLAAAAIVPAFGTDAVRAILGSGTGTGRAAIIASRLAQPMLGVGCTAGKWPASAHRFGKSSALPGA